MSLLRKIYNLNGNTIEYYIRYHIVSAWTICVLLMRYLERLQPLVKTYAKHIEGFVLSMYFIFDVFSLNNLQLFLVILHITDVCIQKTFTLLS